MGNLGLRMLPQTLAGENAWIAGGVGHALPARVAGRDRPPRGRHGEAPDQTLLAYFDEPTTNGYAEGVINKVKVIKRRAYGLPTFTGFRERVLLACS